eukprot:COSAG02_NODE_825_length_16730_cov_58.738260_9_plen_488_part_00
MSSLGLCDMLSSGRVLAVTVLVTALSAVAASGTCSFQHNTDYISSLNVHVAASSLAACCAICAGRTDCAVGTFCTPPLCPAPGQCYIKSNGTKGNAIWHNHVTACFPGKSGPAPPPVPPVPPPAPPLPPAPQPTPVPLNCSSDLDCSLNGRCEEATKKCACYPPWIGHSCGLLSFKPSPRAPAYQGLIYEGAGHSWGGSVVEHNETYHMYAGDFYAGLNHHHLLNRIDYATSPTLEGPYTIQQVLVDAQGVQTVKQTYPNGTARYVMFQSPGPIHVADNPAGPFVAIKSDGFHGASEPAPMLYKGRWYTTTANGPGPIVSAPSLEGPWTEFANPGAGINWRGFGVTIEDPYLYVDAQQHWHLLYHAYNFKSTTDCDSGAISLHAFSTDGKNWTTLSEYVQPYSSKIMYEDGSSHVFSTVERPKMFFDSAGHMTHLFNAAFDPSECHPTACVSCKWNGTLGPLRVGQVGNATTIVRRLDYGAAASPAG